TWLQRREAPWNTHPASRQSSLHHLAVRRVNCQLGCLAVSQMRHAPRSSVHAALTNALAASGACEPAKLPCAAAAAILPAVSKAVRFDCTRALFPGRDAAAPERQHLHSTLLRSA